MIVENTNQTNTLSQNYEVKPFLSNEIDSK